jgi:hypothetical protein
MGEIEGGKHKEFGIWYWGIGGQLLDEDMNLTFPIPNS